jgi:hypothetical protein
VEWNNLKIRHIETQHLIVPNSRDLFVGKASILVFGMFYILVLNPKSFRQFKTRLKNSGVKIEMLRTGRKPKYIDCELCAVALSVSLHYTLMQLPGEALEDLRHLLSHLPTVSLPLTSSIISNTFNLIP